METGRHCGDPQHAGSLVPPRVHAALPGRGRGPGAGGREPGHAAGHACGHSAFRGRMSAEQAARTRGGQAVPSPAVGGDSQGTEGHTASLSCPWCFLSNPSASHSHLFVAASRTLAPDRALSAGQRGGTPFRRALRLGAENCPSFRPKPSPTPGSTDRLVLCPPRRASHAQVPQLRRHHPDDVTTLMTSLRP